jgi:plastocyanin
MTVKVGSTVRWVNADDHPHRLAFNKAGFLEVPYLLGASQSASQRFDSPGSYDFFCTIHPQMQGTIVAEA